MTSTSTDFLIVGAGPAGASLACFLSAHGLSGIMIAAAPSTAETPRAHITNMAALECLRDIGLEAECLAVATASGNMEHTRWCHSMAGEEYARIHSWGHDPARHGDYEAASPCKHVDLPQTLLEPILIKRAREHGWDVRFNTTFLSYDIKVEKQIKSNIKDNVSGQTYTITSRYLFGCDGARSQVVRQLDFPLIKGPGGGLAFNVLIEADLSELVKSRVGNLHWIIQPERDPPVYAWMSIARMVKPWTRWMMIVFPRMDYDVNVHGEPTMEQWEEEVRLELGDNKIPFEIIGVSKWAVNEIVAEKYSEGNIFCLGDAVHRHPPFNGLGSNTCIQDAYNLAWKIALVYSNVAKPLLLASYSPERQPIGHGVITRANKGFRDHLHVWEALGITDPDLSSRLSKFNTLKSPTPAGRDRRASLRAAIETTAHEFHALGQEMNYQYASSAIYTLDEAHPRPTLPADPVLTHMISTYPGSRLPHAWLNSRVPTEHKTSTIDLAGHGAFALLTGVGGDTWLDAARTVSKDLGVSINAYRIGWCQDWEDVYFDWERRREVDEDGCILVRPDRIVCWRAMSLGTLDTKAHTNGNGSVQGSAQPNGAVDPCVTKLRRVMKAILGFESESESSSHLNGSVSNGAGT